MPDDTSTGPDCSAAEIDRGNDDGGRETTARADGHGTADAAEFERIDWDRREYADDGWFSPERATLLAGLVLLAAVYARHAVTEAVYLVFRWNIGPAGWFALAALVVLIAYVAVPAIRNQRETRRILSGLSRRRLTVAALAFVAGIVALALIGGVFVRQPGLTLDRFQPPVWGSVPYEVTRADCTGAVADGHRIDRPCFGSWAYPLGTDRWGYDMIDLLSVGARVVTVALVVTFGAFVPLAVVVGVVAGYYGGLVDDLLMAYVDAQLSVPAVVVYLLAYIFVQNSFFVLLVAFGLVSWGGVARIVRAETLTRREEGFVLAARSIGGSSGYILRRHVVPNVADSAVPAAFHLAAVLILTEAGLAFLGFHAYDQSWGMTIAEGLFTGPAMDVWWVSTFPAAALAGTVLALKVAGDGLRDVLDPRGGP